MEASDTLNVGVLVTLRVVEALLVQEPLAPVTVYVVVVEGFKFCVAPERFPGIQV